jgi:hypothetical protein
VRDATEWRLFALFIVASGWLFVYFEKLNNPNELVRVYMARAIVEHRTYAIGERRRAGAAFQDAGSITSDWGYVNDKALVCDDPTAQPPECAGKLYAAKAPGASFLAVPVLAVLEAVLRRTPTRLETILALRWILCIVPTAIFWVAFRRFLLRNGVSGTTALACTLAGALGSLSFTYGQMFAGHQLAALALGTSFLAAFSQWSGTSQRTALLTGFAAGFAVCCDYAAAPAAAIVVAGWFLSRRASWRTAALSLLAAVPPLLLMAHFHWAAFGSPWSTPYSHLENPAFARDISPGFLGISLPTWERFANSFFLPPLGLFFWSPWIAVALGAAPFLLRRPHMAGGTALAVVAYYVVFQVTHALWRSGWSVGPRYITPVVPFAAATAAFAVAELDARARPWAVALLGGAGAASVVATGIASSVCQGFPLEVYNPLVEVVAPLLAHGYVAPNLLQLAGVPGLWSALPALAALTVGVALLLTTPLRIAPEARGPYRIALAIAALLVIAQWTATSGDAPEHRGAVRFLASVWEPNPPPGARPFSSR